MPTYLFTMITMQRSNNRITNHLRLVVVVVVKMYLGLDIFSATFQRWGTARQQCMVCSFIQGIINGITGTLGKLLTEKYE